MANTGNSDKWYFTKEQLENTPSRKCGFDDYKELQYRQQAANFIQDMGQRLKVSQLCINTAIVYMHRFYVFHSFTNFPWHQMAAAALFLAAKVEEQPRKLEYVIRVANICKNPRDSSFDINSERYIAQSQDLVFNENVLLQTLGFDVAIDHPHTYVVRCCHLVRASKDLAQTSYFMASNSLHLTTMCIQYKPTVVACFCILLACKWSNWEIPLSNEKKEWYTYVDPTVTAELLQQLTSEFLVIFENCPSRLKEKIMAKQESSGSPFEQDRKPESSSQRALEFKGDDPHKHRSRPHEASASGHRSQEQREREYKERKEKERIAHMSGIALPHHHRPERPPIDPKMKLHARPSSSQPYPPNARSEPRDILREAAKDSPFGIPTVRDPTREQAKDPFAARSDKEIPKRDPLLNPKVQTDPNSLTNYSDVRQQRIDPSRSRIDPSKSASKQDMMRRYEEQKPHIKTETDNIKKHLSSSFDKNSAYLKSSSSTSQKIKSPFSLDNKSVPKMSSSQAAVPPKAQFNGNTNGSYNKPPPQETEVKIKTEPLPIKEEIPTPAFIKRPSLFSPEKTPPQVKLEIKSEPLSQTSSSFLSNLTALSPINSPPSVPSMRNRNYSSSSEPELRPTMKKIDQVEGFENLMRDSTIGMANISGVNDTIPDAQEPMSPLLNEIKTERMSPNRDSSQNPLVNGLETNPTLISNLLKEAASTSHLPGVATTSIKTEPVETSSLVAPPPEHKEKEHHHKSKKKKEKHKHRDKDKHREDKEKKKKHKDKDREKHKHKERKEVVESRPLMSEPIKIKIQRDKIQPLSEGLKIKIPKDKIKTDGIVDPLPQPSSGGLKIKIPKEMITNCNTSSGHIISSVDTSMSGSSGSSRKRERDRSSPADTPPLKISKSSHRDSKQNGRHSYNKVSKNPQSSSKNFTNIAQVDSSLSDSTAVSEKKPSEAPSLPINIPVEENNNEELIKDFVQNTLSCKEPSSPKDVSSTVEMVSPTPLSPILSPISPIHEPVPQIDDILIPLSPISASNTPLFEQDMHISDISNTSSFHPETVFNTSQLSLDRSDAFSSFQKASNPLREFRSNTPPGYPTNTFLSYEENHTNSLQTRSTPPPKYTSNSPPPYHQKHTISQWQPRSSTPPTYRTSQSVNNSVEGRNPLHYNSNPYKLDNQSPYKRSNASQFQKQHRNSGNYDNYEYSSYNPPPPYQSKGHRTYNPPPRYPSRGSSNHQPPPPQTVNTYDFPPLQPSQDTQIHYTTAPPQLSFSAYQVVPPNMPNVNVPPPSYGMYTSFFGGYMYPDMYQQPVSGFGGVGQPPLPMEAPPSEVPPPPPPE